MAGYVFVCAGSMFAHEARELGLDTQAPPHSDNARLSPRLDSNPLTLDIFLNFCMPQFPHGDNNSTNLRRFWEDEVRSCYAPGPEYINGPAFVPLLEPCLHACDCNVWRCSQIISCFRAERGSSLSLMLLRPPQGHLGALHMSSRWGRNDIST